MEGGFLNSECGIIRIRIRRNSTCATIVVVAVVAVVVVEIVVVENIDWLLNADEGATPLNRTSSSDTDRGLQRQQSDISIDTTTSLSYIYTTFFILIPLHFHFPFLVSSISYGWTQPSWIRSENEKRKNERKEKYLSVKYSINRA